jgi:predicted PurR-regulated permease PerM
MTEVFRRFAPGLLLFGLSVLVYQVMSHFVVPVAWAAILAYITWPLHRRIAKLLGGRDTLAALTTTLLLSALIVAPLVWIGFLLQAEIAGVYDRLPRWLEQKPALPGFAARIPYLGAELERLLAPFDDLRALLRERAAPWLRRFSGWLPGMLGDVGYHLAMLGFSLLTLFFLYRDGPDVNRQVRLVLHRALGARLDGYMLATKTTLKAVVYGIVLTAIAQGGMAGVGYWATGVEAPILLSLITMFFALVPFGTPLAWGAVSLWLLAGGHGWAGFSLALWGSLVVSWVDNIVRPLVISGATRIPFLLVFFGVLGGLAHFGLIGLFLGPVVLAIALAVWREWVEHGGGAPEGDSNDASGEN